VQWLRNLEPWDQSGPGARRTRETPYQRKIKIMGDKSPKSVNKKAAQKQSKNDTSNRKKQQAAAAKQAVPAKKK
jgi:hypothetical protein